MSFARFAAATLAAALTLTGCKDEGGGGAPPPEENHPPAVDAGPDRHVAVGAPVVLQATGSDTDGDALSYTWNLVAPYGSRARLAVLTGSETAFAPDVDGTYFVVVTAHDGAAESDPAILVVTVGDGVVPPEVLAYAGPDRVGPLHGTITLDGTGSMDPSGYPLQYAWTWVSVPEGSVASITGAASAKATFTPDVPGAYRARLTVKAIGGAEASDEVVVTAENLPPVASPGGDRDVYVGEEVALAAGAVDPNGDPISYAWQLVSRPEQSDAELAGATGATATLVPDVAGWYVVSLVVSDASASADPVTLTVRAYPKLAPLAHRVLDADYADASDRIVMIDEAPNALYVYDPVAKAETRVLLSLTPIAVSVSPDGKFAAVAHDGYVSYVDLAGATVVRVIPVPARVAEVVLAGNGYAYAFGGSSFESLRAVNVATGAVTTIGSYWGYTGRARLHPGGAWIYSADQSVSPADIRRLDVSGGATVTSYDSPYHGDYAMCGDLWISEDGARIFTACGNTFRATATRATDMTYAGKLEGTSATLSVADSAEAAQVLAVPAVAWNGAGTEDTLIRVYESTYLTQTGFVPVSPFRTPMGTFAGHARRVYFSADGTRRFALVQADPAAALVKDFAVMTF